MKLALAENVHAGTLNVLAAKSMPGTQNVLPFINVTRMKKLHNMTMPKEYITTTGIAG